MFGIGSAFLPRRLGCAVHTLLAVLEKFRERHEYLYYTVRVLSSDVNSAVVRYRLVLYWYCMRWLDDKKSGWPVFCLCLCFLLCLGIRLDLVKLCSVSCRHR